MEPRAMNSDVARGLTYVTFDIEFLEIRYIIDDTVLDPVVDT
jgi:hypothetical protein